MFTTKLCPQLITLAILLLVNIITVALFAGPSVLKLIFKQGPIGHTLVFAFKLLFVFALGLGALLIVVGTFSGILAALPRSDKWIKVVEKVLGIGMIILGCYFIFRAGILSI